MNFIVIVILIRFSCFFLGFLFYILFFVLFYKSIVFFFQHYQVIQNFFFLVSEFVLFSVFKIYNFYNLSDYIESQDIKILEKYYNDDAVREKLMLNGGDPIRIQKAYRRFHGIDRVTILSREMA